jgi:hypothetical protein
MLHLTAQQRAYGDDSTPDPQELAEYARDLRAIRARQRTEKLFCNVNDNPWPEVLDTEQPF